MVDPITGAAAAAGALAKRSKDDEEKLRLLRRVLGPPADALGDALGRWVEARTRNVGRVLESAERRLGDDIEKDEQVPPRVAARILEDGSYCDDDLMVEYLGGVLASSRSGVSRDDRGTRWVSLVTSLSAYEVRLHYVMYAGARDSYLRLGRTSTEWGNEATYGPDLRLFFGFDEVAEAMDFVQSESASEILSEAMFALHREGLLRSFGIEGRQTFVPKFRRLCSNSGCVTFEPSTVGVQLFMWAQGLGSRWRSYSSGHADIPELEVPKVTGMALEEMEEATDEQVQAYREIAQFGKS